MQFWENLLDSHCGQLRSFVQCTIGEAPELVMEAMKLSKIMVHTIISRYGFANIIEDRQN